MQSIFATASLSRRHRRNIQPSFCNVIAPGSARASPGSTRLRGFHRHPPGRAQESQADADEHLRRVGAHTAIMTVWRTDADPRCFDLSIDPSDLPTGPCGVRTRAPGLRRAVGFARNCTPEAWLLTWSGLSLNAALAKTAPSIQQPTLLVEYTGDVSTFPSVAKEIFGAIGSSQKSHVRVRGDHHGRALTDGEELGRTLAGRKIAEWLRQHFSQ